MVLALDSAVSRREAVPPWPPSTLLAGLPEPLRARLLHAGAPVRFAPGQPLIREGDRGDFVILLLQGWFKVVAGADHSETLMAIRTGGDLVGELGYLDHQGRSATVRAVCAGSGRKILGGEFDKILGIDAQMAAAVARAMSAKLRWANRRRLDISGFGADVCLARVIHELATAYGHPEGAAVRIGVQLTQREVAALAGAREATAHRVLTSLRNRRIIATGYRRLVVLDLRRLAESACLTDPDDSRRSSPP